MKPISALFLTLLFLFPLVVSFSASDYLYPGEKEMNITTERIYINNTLYEIIQISGKDTFLIDGGTLVSDGTAIRERMGQYYKERYYPTSAEFSELRSNIVKFNDSSNGITEFGNARYECSLATSIAISPCTDIASCMLPATITCTRTESACDVPLFASYIADYVQNLAKLDEHNANALNYLDSVDPYSIQTNLDSVKSELDSSESYANNILKSKLMYPTNISACPDCLGICPQPPFDFDSLDRAREETDALEQKALSMAVFDVVGNNIATETAARLLYKSKECVNGTKHETCAPEKPKYCFDKNLIDKASVCGCPEGFGQNGESCAKKEGCAYDNPSCASSSECINNACVLRKGCQYSNPSCDSSHDCINNTCALKKGCEYGNPSCSSGEECSNNTCYQTCGVTQERVDSSRSGLESLRDSLQSYPEKALLVSKVHKANGDEEGYARWVSVQDDFSSLNETLGKSIKLLESYEDKPGSKCAFRDGFEQYISQLDSKLASIQGKIVKG